MRPPEGPEAGQRQEAKNDPFLPADARLQEPAACDRRRKVRATVSPVSRSIAWLQGRRSLSGGEAPAGDSGEAEPERSQAERRLSECARLGFTLISNHAFVDGNKRIGMYVMLTFLEVNGIRIEATNDEVADVGLKVASGEMSYESLLDWVRSHRVY